PMGLNMFENIPFWHTFLTSLDFEVVLSERSSLELYNRGRYSIPSDTACYPAKLMHGHIESLISQGVDYIFYPCMTYNFDEHTGDNCYNCPVVAYYPELLRANVERLSEVSFLYPYFGLHRKHDFIARAGAYFSRHVPGITRSEIRRAANAAYSEYENWQSDLRDEGSRSIEFARKNKLDMVILAGRPYHIDPEINHGIDKMLQSFGLVVLSEDCVAHLVEPQSVNVLNQWTYHARLYNSAKYCTLHDDVNFVQLVSFGCGLDAITTDEARDILESGGKFYTQLKIDEISNLGPARIRIRSLLGAIDEQRRRRKNGAK
ncbi:MAG: acyl-CoA dehydratase activase-related protein, partial [Clostridia bacterium]